MTTIQPIRPSPIAGTWYSSNANTLANQIDLFIANATLPTIDGNVIGILAPHAGYQYSGSTAGYAFQNRSIDQRFDLVVILSPFHAYHSASVLSSAHLQYATPFGNVPVSRFVKILSSSMFEKGMQFKQIANDKEHSLEIEIPFLQRSIIGNFEILP